MSRLTVSVILILIGIGAYFFFFTDQWNALQEVRLDTQAANDALTQLTEISAKADNLREVYNSVKQENKDKLAKMVPVGPDTTSLVTDFDQLAVRNGLFMKSIDFGGVGSGKATPQTGMAPDLKIGAYTLPISLEVSGSYDAFRRYLADLELNQRIIDISSLNFGATANGVYSFSVHAEGYYQ